MNRFLPCALLATLVAVAPARAQVLPTDVAVLEDVDGSIWAASNNPMADAYLQAAACALYKAYPDADPEVLFVVSSVPLGFLARTQSGIAVHRQTRGIGIGAVNNRAKSCAVNKRLKHAVRMGSFDSLPDDPHAQLKDRPELSMHALAMMAHELGHYWLAYPSYDRKDGSGQQCDLRVYTPDGGTSMDTRCGGYPVSSFGLHWSFLFESGGVMFGSPHIEDKGDGTFRFWGDGTFKFGPLDQYLMGLRLKEQVGPLLLVRTSSSAVTSGDYPVFPGAGNEKIVEGTRVDVTAQDIANFEGERIPPIEPCHWKGTLVLVYQKGKKPANLKALTETLALYGNAFEGYYPEATDQRGSFDLTLDGRGTGTPDCPGLPLHPPEDTGGPADEPATDDVPTPTEVPATDLPTPIDEALPDVPAPLDAPDRPDAAVEVPDTATADGTGVTCVPGATRCNPVGNGVAQRCTADGRTWETLEDCAVAGKSCTDGACAGGSGGGCAANGVPAPASPLPLPAAALVIATLGLVARAARRRDARA